MPKIEIKEALTGKTMYEENEALSLKECLVNAIKDNAHLSGADLTGADLRGAYLRGADLRGAYLSGADLSGADLSGADLSGAYLRGAYLRGADLTGADLRGAYLTGDIKISKTPIQVSTGVYFVSIYDNHMQIGCEFHKISEWWDFNNEKIAKMDGIKARKFWHTWKNPLKAICEANERC